MTNPADLMAPAREAMRLALEIVRESSPGRVTVKGDRDVASEVDVRVEDQLHAFLACEAPEVGFLGEEHGGSDLVGPTWVLDPIDGTTNYVHGFPIFAVSLALVENGHPSLGLISMPVMNLHYSASTGTGATCNDELIATSSVSALQDALVSFGDFSVGNRADELNAKRIKVLERLAANVERVRMIGSAATDLAWVAHGRLDGTMLMSDKPWDVAAGVIIAREAGAIVTDPDGSSHQLGVPGTFAVTPLLADAFHGIGSV